MSIAATTTLSKERLMNVLLAPHVSEKSARMAERDNQVVFRVRRDASKPEIKAAVELLFEVKVDAVRVVNVAGKAKRFWADILGSEAPQ